MNIGKMKRSTQIAILAGAGSSTVEKTVSGTAPLTLSDSVAGNLHTIEVKGRSRTSKNLIDVSDGSQISAGYILHNLDINLQVGSYTLSGTLTTPNPSFALTQNGTAIINATITLPYTFTISENDAYKISLYVGEACSWSNIQLESGSTATPYEPYFSGIKSIGDAGWGVVDLGSLTWTYVSSDSIFYAGVNDGEPSINTQEGTGKGLCSVYNIVQKTYANMVDYDMLVGSRIGGTNKMYICAKNTAYTDATAFKFAMSGDLLYYPLADTTGATPIFGITSKNGAGQGTAATITTGLPLCSTTDGTVYDELTNDKVITRCEVVSDEVVPLATPVETPLTSTEVSALASLRTYDHTTHIDATDNPLITVKYMGKKTTRTAPKKRTSRKKKA